MRLTVLGSGDAFSSGGRFPSCYMIDGSAMRFMVDCGPSVLPALKRAGISTASIPYIFISHLHGDHIGGLPFFILDCIYISRRTEPLTIIGPPGLESRCRLACELFYTRWTHMERGFELNFIELEAHSRQDIHGIGLTPLIVNHFSGSLSFALRFDIDGKVFAFSGDAGWSDAIVRAGNKADLYLLECYQYDYKLSMHLDYLTIAENFDRIDAKKIVLTHMGDGMLAQAAKVDLERYRLAEDGMIIDF